MTHFTPQRSEISVYITEDNAHDERSTSITAHNVLDVIALLGAIFPENIKPYTPKYVTTYGHDALPFADIDAWLDGKGSE